MLSIQTACALLTFLAFSVPLSVQAQRGRFDDLEGRFKGSAVFREAGFSTEPATAVVVITPFSNGRNAAVEVSGVIADELRFKTLIILGPGRTASSSNLFLVGTNSFPGFGDLIQQSPRRVKAFVGGRDSALVEQDVKINVVPKAGGRKKVALEIEGRLDGSPNYSITIRAIDRRPER